MKLAWRTLVAVWAGFGQLPIVFGTLKSLSRVRVAAQFCVSLFYEFRCFEHLAGKVTNRFKQTD